MEVAALLCLEGRPDSGPAANPCSCAGPVRPLHDPWAGRSSRLSDSGSEWVPRCAGSGTHSGRPPRSCRAMLPSAAPAVQRHGLPDASPEGCASVLAMNGLLTCENTFGRRGEASGLSVSRGQQAPVLNSDLVWASTGRLPEPPTRGSSECGARDASQRHGAPREGELNPCLSSGRTAKPVFLACAGRLDIRSSVVSHNHHSKPSRGRTEVHLTDKSEFSSPLCCWTSIPWSCSRLQSSTA